MPKDRKYGITRKYRRVFFLSLITFGIYYIMYHYWIFQDFEIHHERAFTTEPRSYPLKANPTTMLIFMIVFPLYTIYTKYTLLHDHIRTSKVRSPENCANGVTAILSFIFFGVCTLGIHPLLTEKKWQNAFNEHILAHEQQQENIQER